jgi:hypothetical protein
MESDSEPNLVPPGHGESHTDEDTLWNRPDRGLPPAKSEHVDEVTADWDEDGLHLHVVADDGDHDFRVANPEGLLDAVSDAVVPWLIERDEAKAAYDANVRAGYEWRDGAWVQKNDG